MGAKKLGRPTDNPKITTIKIRFDKDSAQMLEECSQILGVSRAEIVRQGVRRMHESLPK